MSRVKSIAFNLAAREAWNAANGGEWRRRRATKGQARPEPEERLATRSVHAWVRDANGAERLQRAPNALYYHCIATIAYSHCLYCYSSVKVKF